MKWKAIADCPGPGRMLACAAGGDGALFVVGGVTLEDHPGGGVRRRYLRDAYRYDVAKDAWTRLSDLPGPIAAAPSPAPWMGKTGFYVLGGDDGALAGVPPQERHPGFLRTAWFWDVRGDAWVAAGRIPAPRVTVPCAAWNGAWVIPSGEIRPGVRSAEVWAFTPAIGKRNHP